jgi:hypothetical protein
MQENILQKNTGKPVRIFAPYNHLLCKCYIQEQKVFKSYPFTKNLNIIYTIYINTKLQISYLECKQFPNHTFSKNLNMYTELPITISKYNE